MKRSKLYILITIVITSYSHLSCTSNSATENAASGPSPEQISAARSSAEGLFANRADLAKLRHAVNLMAGVRDPNGRNYDVEWTFAKYNYFLGRYATDDAEAEKAFDTGRDAARIAANMHPERAEGHFWYGANLGELCKRSPITVGLRNVDDVRESMKKVIEIDPGYQGASAFDVLGQIELATRIKDGTAEKAVEYLEKALDFEKENSNIYVHLAEAYLALDKDAEAKKQLEYVLRMKPSPDYIPEHNASVEIAKKLLSTKF
ncbi:MAG: tetratricopeptide repeat protein [Pyrinomonadaceae bacterium]